MKREVVITKDGSATVAISEKGITYHSVHGAIQESEHVFINAGLRYWLDNNNTTKVRVFEMGFGTGLNALLSYQYAAKHKLHIHYHSVEQFPLSTNEIKALNYGPILDATDIFDALHSVPWDIEAEIFQGFTLSKEQKDLLAVDDNKRFNIVFFDAFDPNTQPELWTATVFSKLYGMLDIAGVLVTYCSKGDVRRAMVAAGFTVEKLAGPRGKREMLRAIKRL